jgi:hypothetical protein
MLHAFNQKNVRRVLLRQDDEHSVEKTEDAITSMVFSPLAFMSAPDALGCMLGLLGPALMDKIASRVPVGHDFRLWPIGLKARAWRGEHSTRCEPDLLITFNFERSADLTVIGEFKWDWRMSSDALMRELRRERAAVAASLGGDSLQFVITKYAPRFLWRDVPILTWVTVAARLVALTRAGHGPVRLWAEQVHQFLD